MEIKSSLLNDDDFKYTKNSIIEADKEDGEGAFRVKVIEYINDSSSAEDDEFFFDMLEFVRFLDPDNPEQFKNAIAYTKPDKRIYLNAPGTIIGKKIKQWDFTYDHECLHQLWDTFAVAKKIVKEKGEYDHDLLNIASDCVINDYLVYNRNKEIPDNLITPEYLEKTFGVVYNRKEDTQYSLYLKLLKIKEEKQAQYKKMMDDPIIKKALEDFGDRKIKPKSVQQGNGPTPPPQPSGKHSEEFRKGWTDAIKDVLDKKVDPLKYTPKQEKTDYEKGYNKAMENIKEGLENGVQLSSSNQGSSSNGDLPQIPWDVPQQGGSSNGSNDSKDNSNSNGSGGASDEEIDNMSDKEAADNAQDSADKAQQSADNAKDKASKSGSEKDQKAADKAQKAADKAKKAASDAKNAADKGDSKGAKSGAKAARDAADEAAEVAGESTGSNDGSDISNMSGEEAASDAAESAAKAKAAAEKAEANAKASGSKEDKELADIAKEAAKRAKDAADRAEKAAKEGDEGEARSDAKDARGALADAENAANGNKGGAGQGGGNSGGKPGHEAANDNSTQKEDIAKITQKATETITKYQNKISGDFGNFIRKCRKSLELNPSGLGIGNQYKSAAGWNQKMNTYIITYVKQRVFQKKRVYKKTYSRLKRGSGFVKYGQPIDPGKKRRDEKLTINAAFYVDRSGSMSSSIDNVFKAAYVISESLKKMFSREKVVDEVTFKMHAFDYSMHELKWGSRMRADGGTMSFHEILNYIGKHTNDYLINVIITDAEFDINESEVKKFIKDIKGMIVFVTNNDNATMKKLGKDYKGTLYYILANSSFELS